jgi:DNA-binding CsgD family transcriptional regulator
MSEAVEKYAQNSRMDERSETIKHMLGKGKSSEEIADLCGYDLKFVRQVEESMAQTV